MKRRDFLKTAGAATAGAFAAPYILPSGRLFAATGAQYAEYVVYVLFAGGVRYNEVINRGYLKESQASNGETQDGNIMPNMFTGILPASKRVFGKGAGGATPITRIWGSDGDAGIGTAGNLTIEEMGTTFQDVRAASRGHYGGLNSLLQGNPASAQGLQNKPINPTIFEYVRRHLGLPATKVWMVGNGIGNGVPLLNHSDVEGYGAEYGANFFAPSTTFKAPGQSYLMNAKQYTDPDLDHMRFMQNFLDNQFSSYGPALKKLGNTDAEIKQIKQFMDSMFQKELGPGPYGTIAHAPEFSTGDLGSANDVHTCGYVAEILNEFSPNLTVVNFNSVDSCHSDFTNYVQNLARADYAVGYLWDVIQNHPQMKDKTIMILSPECGRNLNPNPIQDQTNLWNAYDHSDDHSLKIFTQMIGGSQTQNVPVNHKVGGPNADKYSGQQIGSNIDNILTIGEIFGIDTDIINAGHISSSSNSLFNQL